MSTPEARKRANDNYRKKIRRVCLDLSPDMYAALYELACSRSMTVTEIIREIISFHVDI